MASLKHLLNGPADECAVQRPDPPFSWDNSAGPAFSDIPVLPDQSLSRLFGELLNSEVDYSQPDIISSDEEPDNFDFQYVQEGIEQWAAHDLPASTTIVPGINGFEQQPTHYDTLGDSNELLCYGMIYRAATRLYGDMSQVTATLNSHRNSRVPGYYVLGLKNIVKEKPQQITTFLTSADGSQIATLNSHLSNALRRLIDYPNLQFEATAHIQTTHEIIKRATKANDAIVRVNIYIYGPQHLWEEAGNSLSAEKVFLQRPDHMKTESRYDNPHFIKFPNMDMLQISNHLQELKPDGEAVKKDVEHFRKAVSKVYSSLTRGKDLQQIEGDQHIKSTLLEHQKKALYFMMQREVGPVPDKYSLWEETEIDGQKKYVHKITKARSSDAPAELGGGILADEMGMGKSLSILSLVMKTLRDGHNWAAEEVLPSPEENIQPKRRVRGTLVIVWSALLINNWFNEINKHIDGSLKTIKYHGRSRASQIPHIEDADIVLTTYHTLATDLMPRSSSRSNFRVSPLHDISWFRVVLDEAHIIRRQSTTFYRTVTELNANFRWCLTGTPIQNRLEDIGALFSFIRARPFDSMAVFRRFIVLPFNETEEREKVASERLSRLIDSVCLRRTRDLLDLPERQERVREIVFSPEEQQQYDLTKDIMDRTIKEQVGDITRKSIFGMFQAQLQLRLLCNHGTFQRLYSWHKRCLIDEKEDALSSLGQSAETRCSVCRIEMPIMGSNNLYGRYLENCAHVICSECLYEHEEEGGQSNGAMVHCPLCVSSGAPLVFANGNGHGNAPSNLHKDDAFNPDGYSSKMMYLMRDIKEDLHQKKSIIFSCWTRTLNLVERHLRHESIYFERIDGDCPLPKRQKILDDFATRNDVRVLIMTTGTGAYGLNLTSANRVFIVEPQWNPSVENQAIARAIRLGQGSSVIVTRYLVKGTVEQQMRSQQDRKLKIAEIGWDG